MCMLRRVWKYDATNTFVCMCIVNVYIVTPGEKPGRSGFPNGYFPFVECRLTESQKQNSSVHFYPMQFSNTQRDFFLPLLYTLEQKVTHSQSIRSNLHSFFFDVTIIRALKEINKLKLLTYVLKLTICNGKFAEYI